VTQIERPRWQGPAAAGLPRAGSGALCGSGEAWRDRWRWSWLLAVEVFGLRIWAHGRRIRLRWPDLVSMTHIGGTGLAHGDLARACWLDFQVVMVTPLPPDLAYCGWAGRI
jgi:hypothetical protein